MASEMAEQIGARIRQRREELGLNQRELADLLNEPAVGNQRISDWERGVNKPSERYMKVLAAALDRDLAWFYGMEKGPTPDLLATSDPDGTDEQLDRIEAMLAELLIHFGLRQPDEVDGRTRAAFEALADQARSDLPSADPPVPIARTKRSQRRAER